MKRSTFVIISGAAATAAACGLPVVALASADMTLTTATGKLAGTLELPATSGAPPIVLIIAGSGPTDRDGNSPALPGKNDALKQLALGLASRGVASLRYDKRGVGASAPAMVSEADLRFDTYVDDAVAWIKELRAQKRFARVVVAGHSEGSLIGMLAAVRAPADGYVSLEGAGRPAQTILHDQVQKSASAPPELKAESDRVLAELAAGRTVNDVSPALAPLFRASVQPYMISWFRYDPAHEIAAVRGPAAIVQGTADVQVTRVDGDALHAALPTARYVVVEGMNHVLKHAPDTSSDAALLAGYTNPALQIEPIVVDTVARIALGQT
jgi:uncharacterized protein